jgi:hypothetical protein
MNFVLKTAAYLYVFKGTYAGMALILITFLLITICLNDISSNESCPNEFDLKPDVIANFVLKTAEF